MRLPSPTAVGCSGSNKILNRFLASEQECVPREKKRLPTQRVQPFSEKKRRRRRQKARGPQRFPRILSAPKMGAENAARERRDPSPSPAVADARVTSISADNLPTPRVGADASVPPPGGAPPRPSTPTPAVASSSEGEAPAAPDDAANVAAPREQATGAFKESAAKIETGSDEATVARMRVKEEMAIAQAGGETVEEMQGGFYVRNAKGGDDDDNTGSVTVERKCGGPGLSSGFNGTSRLARHDDGE